MKAVKRFKDLVLKKRPELLEGILGRGSRIVQPPLSIRSPTAHHHKARSVDLDDRRPIERALATEGVHHEITISDDMQRLPERMDSCVLEADDVLLDKTQAAKDGPKEKSSSEGSAVQRAEIATHHPPNERKATNLHQRAFSEGKGHAHDPLMDTLFLDIGTGIEGTPTSDSANHVISESPSAVDMNVYEVAYQEEVERILKAHGRAATMYLTRRVEHKKELREHKNIVDHSREHAASVGSGFSKMIARAQEKAREKHRDKPAHDADTAQDQNVGKSKDKDLTATSQGNVLAKIKGFEDKAAAASGRGSS